MMTLDPYDQSRANLRRVRKRYLVIGVSTVVLLVGVIALSVGIHNSRKSNNNDLNGSTKLVQSMCSQTSYPQECVSSISATPSTDPNNPKSIVTAAITVAQNQVKSLVTTAELYLKSELNITIKAALEDCMENLDSAMDQLKLTASSIDIKALLTNSSFQEDLTTFMSSAMTFHSTCIDGFEGISGTVSDKIHLDGSSGQRFLSNSLALLQVLFSKLPSAAIPQGLPVRRLLHLSEEELPEWVPASTRRLLQANPSPNVVVAKDKRGTFKKIQDAVDAAPLKSKTPFIIYIKKGVYNENVIVPKKAINLVFIGDGRGKTIITGSKNVQQSGVTTFNSATVGEIPVFSMLNLIRNTAGPDKHQAVGLRVSADQVVVYRSSLEAFQDTLYTHTFRQFYRECTVIGTVDFVFGNGAVVLQNSTILATVGNPGQQVTFTAQGRVDKNQNTGLSFISCKIDATPALRKEIGEHPSYLGRPWKLYSRTVYLQSFISDIIDPRGWLEWSGDFALSTLFYGEYQNTGPGANRSKRVSWSTGITDKKVAKKFTVKSFIGGSSWIRREVPFTPGL